MNVYLSLDSSNIDFNRDDLESWGLVDGLNKISFSDPRFQELIDYFEPDLDVVVSGSHKDDGIKFV
jgi:hypothetical protein